MNDMKPRLPEEIANLWNDYLRAEQDRIRVVVTECLARFIDRLLHEDARVARLGAPHGCIDIG
jgi:hypothetical protein